MYYTVALTSFPYASLTYSKPKWLHRVSWGPGLRVIVFLGNSLRLGVILDSSVNAPAHLDPSAIKDIVWVLENEPLFSCKYLQLVQELALRQAVTPGKIFAAILPAKIRSHEQRMRLTQGSAKPIQIKLSDLKNKSECELMILGEKWASGDLEYVASKKDTSSIEVCILNTEPPWSVRPSAMRQRKVLDFLFENGPTPKRILLKTLGLHANILYSLMNHGLIVLEKEQHSFDNESVYSKVLVPEVESSSMELSVDQKNVLSKLIPSIQSKKTETFLLFGITGSGKTLVYIEAIRECIRTNRSVIVLAPEVALAYKLKLEVCEAFPNTACHFVHGYQSAQEKEYIFKHVIKKDTVHIIVGTRSALFLPIENVGLIVIDEEHDSSFKQDERLGYQAKDIAWFRSIQSESVLLLGSATPDVKTFYAAKESKIVRLDLPNRIGSSFLPKVKIVDSTNENLKGTVLSAQAREALQETVSRDEQAIILLNRRGYALIMYCTECGNIAKCPHCDISLTYHKARESLVCHYCGYKVLFPCPCVACRSVQFNLVGCGTEQVEEEIRTVLPAGKNVLRLDRDTTRKIGRMDEILKTFAQKKADVLVGTQMLSKGHHFPDVTLVIVANADMLLNFPDYRAAEKTFQLLMQSAGRAGRGEKPGQVLIQTRDISHYCWEFIQKHDYVGFYEHEMALRKKWKYPPFTCMALLRFSYSSQWVQGKQWIAKVAQYLDQYRQNKDIVLRGPIEAPIPMVKGERRYQCLVKGCDWKSIRSIYMNLQANMVNKKVKIALDIDPITML